MARVNSPAATGIGAAGLDSPIARWTIVAGAVVGLVHVLIEGRVVEGNILALVASAATVIGALLLTAAGAGPLHRRAAVPLLLCVVLGGATALLTLDPVDLAWTIAFASYLAGLSTARGNVVIGGVGCGALMVMTVVWALETKRDLGTFLTVFAPIVAGVVVGYGWYWLVRRFAHRERSARDAVADSAAAAVAAKAAEGAFAGQLREIGAMVGPMLEAIESGQAIDEVSQNEFAIAEADVRDRIRVPRLHHPLIQDAVSRARRRGVRVDLLGEPDGRAPLDADAALLIAEALDAMPSGIAVIRTLPPDRSESATVLTQHDGVVRRFTIIS